MAVVVNDLWSANLFVNFADSGAGELYHLRATNAATAMAAAEQLARKRALLLAKNAEISFVRVIHWTYPPVVHNLTLPPLTHLTKSDGSSYWGELHTPHDALWWYLRAAPRRWSTRPIRFYAGAEVKANRWIREGLTIPAITPALPPFPASAPPELLWQHVLGSIRDLTLHARDLPPAGGVAQWEVNDFSEARFTKVGRRRVGARFLPMSWEVNDWNKANDFSPCGTITTYMRRPYVQKCRFYVDGIANEISYYRAPPGAVIMSYPTIFWGWAGYQVPTNTLGPGEIGVHHKDDWHPGFASGAAPGIGPTGAPSRFLGFDVCPWGATVPTPLFQRAGCDMPLPIKAQLDDLSVIVNPSYTFTFKLADGFTITDLGNHEALIGFTGGGGTVDGTGTPNYIAVWDDADTLRDGTATDDGTTFELQSRLACPWQSVTGLGADEASVDPGDNVLVRMTAVGATSIIRGIQGGTNGRWLVLWFSGFTATLTHDDAGAAAGERLFLDHEDDLVCEPNTQAVLRWSSDSNGWRVMSVQHASQDQPGLVSLDDQDMGQGAKYFQQLVSGTDVGSGIPAEINTAGFALIGTTVADISLSVSDFNGACQLNFRRSDGAVHNVMTVNNALLVSVRNLADNGYAGIELQADGDHALNLTNTDDDPTYGVNGLLGIRNTDHTIAAGDVVKIRGGLWHEITPSPPPPPPVSPPYSITGTIVDDMAAPLASVLVQDMSGPLGNTLTAADGTYAFHGVFHGTSYDLHPQLSGYSFAPFSAPSIATAPAVHDFVGTAVPPPPTERLYFSAQLGASTLAGVVPRVGSHPWTWSIWVKIASVNVGPIALLTCAPGYDADPPMLGIRTNGVPYVSNYTTDVDAVTAIDDDAWHCLTVVYQSGLVKIYLDGVQDASGFISFSDGNWYSLLHYDHTSVGAYIDGYVQAICCYQFAATFLIVGEHWNSGIEPYYPISGPSVKYIYKCDEGSGGNCFEFSGQHGPAPVGGLAIWQTP